MSSRQIHHRYSRSRRRIRLLHQAHAATGVNGGPNARRHHAQTGGLARLEAEANSVITCFHLFEQLPRSTCALIDLSARLVKGANAVQIGERMDSIVAERVGNRIADHMVDHGSVRVGPWMGVAIVVVYRTRGHGTARAAIWVTAGGEGDRSPGVSV